MDTRSDVWNHFTKVIENVTGASRGYAFVEYETEREMRHAYEDAYHSLIDDSEVIVDYSRQQLMPEWIPRRLGGGLGGKKESGQLRFGGRERPFRVPLRIPYDELKRLGIPPPPEGRYMSRFQIPSPPRRRSSIREGSPSQHRRSEDREEPSSRTSSYASSGDLPPRQRGHEDTEEPSRQRTRRSSHISKDDSSSRLRRTEEREEPHRRWRRSPSDVDESSHKRRRRHSEHSHRR